MADNKTLPAEDSKQYKFKNAKKCDQAPLEHAIMELIAEMDFDGYLLTHFDCKIVEEINGAPVQTAALIYSGGRYYIRCVEDFFVNHLTDDERVAVMKHEISHFVQRHSTRRNGRDPMIYNVACDMAINQFIAHMPKDCVTLPKGWPANDAAEVYYDKLMSKAEKGIKIPGQFDTVMDAPPGESADADAIAEEIIRETVKEQLDMGVDQAKLRGLHAGSLEDYIDELTKPPLLDWRHALTRFASSMQDQHSRLTLKKKDRRRMSPFGKKKEYLPKLVAIIDSSGSVSDNMLSTFFSQINLLRRMLSVVYVIVADAEVQTHFEYKRGMEETLRKAALGRGGTDFDPAVQYINKHLRDCDGAVYLTDGYCPEPDTKCAVRMMWIVTDNKEFPGRPMIFAPDDGKDNRRRRR